MVIYLELAPPAPSQKLQKSQDVLRKFKFKGDSLKFGIISGASCETRGNVIFNMCLCDILKNQPFSIPVQSKQITKHMMCVILCWIKSYFEGRIIIFSRESIACLWDPEKFHFGPIFHCFLGIFHHWPQQDQICSKCNNRLGFQCPKIQFAWAATKI